ncbi:hypothetical protein Bhyg_08790, partial [Pseudolycoriella hygida]
MAFAEPLLMEDIDEEIPFEVMQNAELAKLELLPVKSRDKYYRVYGHFKDWQKEHGLKKVVAEYLQLQQPGRYTGHSFRRTSATILANSGLVDMETIMRHGGWRNEKSAKLYIEDSLHYKQRTGNMILSSIFKSSAQCTSPVAGSSTDISSLGDTMIDGIAMKGMESSSRVDVQSLFDSDMDEVAMVEVTERYSQEESFFDTAISDSELVDVTERYSQHEPKKRHVEDSGVDVIDSVRTQAILVKKAKTSCDSKSSGSSSVRQAIQAISSKPAISE